MKSSEFVIITGACGGIGRELVRVYAEAGFQVIGIDIKKVDFFSENAAFINFDVSSVVDDDGSRSILKQQIFDIVGDGSIHALINNAAVQIVKVIENIDFSDWRLTLETNLLAPFFLSQMFLKELDSSGGSILNISSVHARQTKKNFSVYATSKAALSALTRLMAIELGDRIRVNAIEPGAISTQMLEEGFRDLPNERKLLNQIQPMGRIGEPGEVAQLALFLTSANAKFINGSTISIDGGIRNQLHDPI
jgi:NAD(P)-dependent dehydrogenase (short-subunit alcohol dehydrogenase family)